MTQLVVNKKPRFGPKVASQAWWIEEIKKDNQGADRFKMHDLLNPTPIPEKFKGSIPVTVDKAIERYN